MKRTRSAMATMARPSPLISVFARPEIASPVEPSNRRWCLRNEGRGHVDKPYTSVSQHSLVLRRVRHRASRNCFADHVPSSFLPHPAVARSDAWGDPEPPETVGHNGNIRRRIGSQAPFAAHAANNRRCAPHLGCLVARQRYGGQAVVSLLKSGRANNALQLTRHG